MKGEKNQTNIAQSIKHKVREFNELISCYLCNGYLINPTTVDYCYHTYCRSCIVKYLETNSFCPQCKSTGGKRIDVNNLKIDDILRKFIFKLVPDLYHDERERHAQIVSDTRNTEALMEVEENIFSSTEPISLSLEYHPDLLTNCSEDQKPPVCYLQCPAGVKIQHLKHLICAKYEINPENKNVEVEIIYEDEILQNDFSLLDVGYCYNWNRAAPMTFRYRILIYTPENKLKMEEKEANKQLKLKTENEEIAENKLLKTRISVEREKLSSGPTKSVTFATEKTYIDPPADEITDLSTNNNQNIHNKNHHHNNNDANFNRNVEYKLKSSLKVRKMKYKIENEYDEASGLPPPAVKMVIARKPALIVEPQRKTSLKRAQSENGAQNNKNNYNKNSTIVTNDFKSLRSNDMRYSDYAVTSSTTTNQNNVATSGNKRIDNNKLSKVDKSHLKLCIPTTTTTTTTTTNVTKPATAPPMVVVSIPRFPLSSYDKDELFENVTLAQLKTASSKKTIENTQTNNTITSSINKNNNKNNATTTNTKAPNNVPRLKIELNSLKTKITLPKPNTTDAFDQNYEDVELGLKTHKVRKRTYEEMESTNEQVDLETYAKIIGLKPIDSNLTVEKTALKYSPNASPHSSTSNSSNSSVLTNFDNSDLEYSVITLKKRKKKHHSKEGNGGSKKRKLHAEISSQNADESLKMKVKITAAHSHRSHHKSMSSKAEEKVTENSKTVVKSASIGLERTTSPKANVTVDEKEVATVNTQADLQKHKSLENSQSVVEKEQKLENDEIKNSTEIKETAESKDMLPPLIPASPPLPPSLFKTVPPLTLTSASNLTAITDVPLLPPPVRKAKMGVANVSTSVATTTVATKSTSLVLQPKATLKIATPKPATTKLAFPITTTASPLALTQQQKTFAVPALPTRTAIPTGSNSPMRKLTSTMPSTIASAAHKQQQQQHINKPLLKSFRQLDQERQAKNAIDTFTHNFKLPKLPNMKNSSPTSMATFDNRALYTPLASAALSDYTKRIGSHTVTITPRSKLMNSHKGVGTFQMCDLPALQQQQHQQQQQRQSNQIKTNFDFMRSANANKSLMGFAIPSARIGKSTLNGNKDDGNRTTLMGPPLSTIMKSPKKFTNSKTQQNSLSALSFNMSPHVPLSIASLAAVAAAAGNVNVNSSTSLPHGVRSPPLPLTTALAAAKNKSPYRQTPPALINFCNPVNMFFSHTDMQRPNVRDLKYCSNTTMSKSSALDLSGNSGKHLDVLKNPACNTLEAALNKIKQNIMSCTVTTAEREKAGTTTTITTTPTDNGNSLQTLQTLAKEREKLVSMFEKSKLLQQSPAAMVRPQNASVRHIPNPSALAFRNQPTSNVPTTTTSLTPAKSTIQSSPNSVSSPPLSKNVALNVATSNANINSNNQSPPLRATKKPTTIDQVAANLNIRAAAAALCAAATSTTTAPVVKNSEECEKIIKTGETTTTTNNDETSSSTITPTSPTCNSTGLETEMQETSKSAIENVEDTLKKTTNTSTATTILPKPASNLKSIAENSCSSPGPTTVTSIKLEKIAVE